MLPDFERADRIGEFWGYPEGRAFAELLIDCEEDRTLRAVLGMLREDDPEQRGIEDTRRTASRKGRFRLAVLASKLDLQACLPAIRSDRPHGARVFSRVVT